MPTGPTSAGFHWQGLASFVKRLLSVYTCHLALLEILGVIPLVVYRDADMHTEGRGSLHPVDV